jgi:hypothetical protein
MCDLVVAGVDRVHRADAGRYMPVNMKAELVRFLDAGLEPLGIEGAVEFYAVKPFSFALSTSEMASAWLVATLAT